MIKKQPCSNSTHRDPHLIHQKIKGISLAFVFLFQMVPTPMAFAQEEINPKSSYKSPQMGGTIEAEMNGKAIDLPKLKSTIHADIKGNIATVTVEQTFLNPSKSPVHARYLFPLDHNSAVYSMTMETPHEVVQAKIQKKEEAKKTFEAAKKEGKVASLLDQERPNMFTQNIANLMPNQPVKVTLKYVEPISKIDGSYELVIPLIVGPRYEPQKMTLSSILPTYPGVAGLNLPKSIEEDRVSLSVDLDAGLPVKMVKSPSHRIVST
ncbi:MAG: hypothetical protein K2X66_07185, partial [Cyanobacteria bacterium]|nr:hypothetical protein [Cyanobacteriota bacterium]